MKWVLVINSDGGIEESDYANNQASTPVSWKLPDLIVTDLQRPVLTVTPGQPIQLDPKASALIYTVANQGTGPLAKGTTWIDQIWLGTDKNLWAANDPANNVWHLNLTPNGIPRLATHLLVEADPKNQTPGQALSWSFTPDFTGITLPQGVKPETLSWIILTDWPTTVSGAKAAGADPVTPVGNVVEPQEVEKRPNNLKSEISTGMDLGSAAIGGGKPMDAERYRVPGHRQGSDRLQAGQLE